MADREIKQLEGALRRLLVAAERFAALMRSGDTASVKKKPDKNKHTPKTEDANAVISEQECTAAQCHSQEQGGAEL